MRRSLTFLATMALLVGLMAAPAAADAPVEVTMPGTPFDTTDPCTGEQQEITINFIAFEHQGHENNFVARSQRTGTTSAGYVLVSGHEHFQANNNVVVGSFKDVWRNPVNGSRFQASGKLRVTLPDGTVVVDEFELRCVGAPTIL